MCNEYMYVHAHVCIDMRIQCVYVCSESAYVYMSLYVKCMISICV